MEEQTNVWDWTDEIRKIEEREKELEQFRGSVIQDGETIHIPDVARIDEKIVEFQRPDGGVRKVTRYFYHFKDGSKKIVPWDVHRQIGKQIKQFGKNIDIVISKTKTGPERYQVKYSVTAIVHP